MISLLVQISIHRKVIICCWLERSNMGCSDRLESFCGLILFWFMHRKYWCLCTPNALDQCCCCSYSSLFRILPQTKEAERNMIAPTKNDSISIAIAIRDGRLIAIGLPLDRTCHAVHICWVQQRHLEDPAVCQRPVATSFSLFIRGEPSRLRGEKSRCLAKREYIYI